MAADVAVAECLLAVTLALLATSIGIGLRELRRKSLERRWASAREEHEVELQEEALALNEVVDELRELDRKINHFRHNVHCPSCGRFSKQAEGWPAGVADCSAHGIGLRTNSLITGPIAIILQPLDEVAAELPPPETSDFIVSLTIVPDDLSGLLEEAHADR